jgi:hypothetical protein
MVKLQKGIMNIIKYLLSIPMLLGMIGCGCNEARQVINEELGPRALLKKYSWFKDAAAVLDKKVADMRIYEKRLSSLEDSYIGVPKAQWPKDERETHRQLSNELAGIKMSYNMLAAEYNAAMAKENYRFCEVGRLPEGASTPLPREFKPYVEK